MPMDWRFRGLCRDEDPELFFPAGKSGTAPTIAQITKAKGVCQRCPVMEECFLWSLDESIEYGVWGGVDEDQRRAMLKAEGATRRARNEIAPRRPRPRAA